MKVVPPAAVSTEENAARKLEERQIVNPVHEQNYPIHLSHRPQLTPPAGRVLEQPVATDAESQSDWCRRASGRR